MRKHPLFVLLALLFLLAALSACGGAEAPLPTATWTPRPTFTPTPEGQVANAHLFQTPTNLEGDATAAAVMLPTDTPTLVPTDTPTPEPPTPTPTDTPVPAAAFASQEVNVRTGPGTNYNRVGAMAPGQRYFITGKNPGGDWWQIDFNGTLAWVIDNLVQKEGQIDAISVVAALPTPPPAPTRPPAPPTATPAPAQPTATPAPSFPYSFGAGTETCAPNSGTTYFNGFVRDRSNNLLNGVCVHIAFYGPRNTKCSGCDGVGAGNWGFSPFGGPAAPGTTVEIFIVQCPESMPAGGQTQSSGFGNLTPLSDKFVRTIQASEQCTGITFYKN
ncbi:MAG: SH3 domain-containing protein [Caldilineales bacterium]|nr:SH3 domain-containing protein [Caldilineales bacterium]